MAFQFFFRAYYFEHLDILQKGISVAELFSISNSRLLHIFPTNMTLKLYFPPYLCKDNVLSLEVNSYQYNIEESDSASIQIITIECITYLILFQLLNSYYIGQYLVN